MTTLISRKVQIETLNSMIIEAEEGIANSVAEQLEGVVVAAKLLGYDVVCTAWKAKQFIDFTFNNRLVLTLQFSIDRNGILRRILLTDKKNRQDIDSYTKNGVDFFLPIKHLMDKL